MKSSSNKHIGNHRSIPMDQGVVIKKMPGVYIVETNRPDISVSCTLAAALRKQAEAGKLPANKRKMKPNRELEPGESVAVGDQVLFRQIYNGTGEIVDVLPRRNKLSRRSPVPMPDARPHEQVIAANVDQVVPVLAAAQPSPRWNLLDRYLILAESLELPALICITKLDLADGDHGMISEELETELEVYRKLGYPIVLTSSLTGEGIAELRERLKGNLSVFLGKSGVGKTALLNAVQPGLGLRVREVSRISGKGKHTTTHMEMFPLPSGGRIIDTPGTQEFGLWDIYESDLVDYYPEISRLVVNCRFGMGCQHDEEPGCAVRKAVMAEEISPRRYQSYLNLKQELHADERRLS